MGSGPGSAETNETHTRSRFSSYSPIVSGGRSAEAWPSGRPYIWSRFFFFQWFFFLFFFLQQHEDAVFLLLCRIDSSRRGRAPVKRKAPCWVSFSCNIGCSAGSSAAFLAQKWFL